MSQLTQEQRNSYEQDGYLLASDLIAPEIVIEARRTLLERLQERPGEMFQSFSDNALVACYTPEICAAAMLLAGVSEPPFMPPRSILAITAFPTEEVWKPHSPHIDGALRKDDKTVDPPPFRIAGMIYLSDVEPHGGGTLVWRGSHKIIAEVAKSDPIRFEKMPPLNEYLPNVDLGDPLELTPRAGDALFYKCLCAHTGSMNTTNRPRLALNMKW